jgi:hypothetical protein
MHEKAAMKKCQQNQSQRKGGRNIKGFCCLANRQLKCLDLGREKVMEIGYRDQMLPFGEGSKTRNLLLTKDF